ncbi:hypothetical protein UFOVP116_270 [uncultured Caudovirales phage]|uniref:Uncharacterized protein n=1 Tax=uncultured Caudovirales phage TaxID=2100421 RepID=A0A6J5L6S1_9CAUD|nr:hypothetical protein UFOVP116_270 [uncultured Caudovirales phage]
MQISQVDCHPWTHRVDFVDTDSEQIWPIYEWTENEGIPGVWLGKSFITVSMQAVLLALTWAHINKPNNY